MKSTTLIIPGLYGSGPGHWQSWMESRIEGAQRVQQADWAVASLDAWSARVGAAIDDAVGAVWLVAHSFGCLAAVAALAQRSDPEDRVAGMLLVAPANPERFGPRGLLTSGGSSVTQTTDLKDTITALLPHRRLGVPAVVVASSNDPWMRLTAASVWADRWGAQFECIGRAGHINVESGHGPWPQGLVVLERLRHAHGNEPLGHIEAVDTGYSHAHGQRGERMLARQWFG